TAPQSNRKQRRPNRGATLIPRALHAAPANAPPAATITTTSGPLHAAPPQQPVHPIHNVKDPAGAARRRNE
ncbi:MAG TPA: hypothetical protein VHS81_06320, partial [Caulobacteraceae bacterium]|nr:hypothetical protein [Caulobacteraceae bacterium]